ncbi:30S ribosomal protein S6--L-glutamate ligase [Gangjinia marincola]|uniref:30S ribosomal protein S6--L-glutamate ligase n=1 Tax=Gangjinia marincola TaxID=578463 RepID=A0ABN1MIF5_9FLAO
MNIAILSRGANLYSTRSLVKAAEQRNHSIEVIDPTYCQMLIEEGKPKVFYFEEEVNDLHAIIPRIGASNTFQGCTVTRHFEAMNVFATVTSEAILRSRDKWSSFQILANKGVAVPKTAFADFNFNLDHILSQFDHGPLIIKVLEGTHGNGVMLAPDKKTAQSMLEAFASQKIKILIQEFIAESKGEDLRAIVVDGVVVAAMKRKSANGDFRSNLHRGGSSFKINLNYQEEALALKAAKALKLGVCGVDMLRSDQGPMVLEVNSTPGLEGIEKTTGINIAKSIIGYAERNKK